MAVSRTWYLSCSPRSPEKIGPELTELAKLDGVNWREADQDGRKVNQIAFAHFLKQLKTFEGSISASDPAFSARDRLAPMQTYGFAFVDSNGRLRITPAGHWLIAQRDLQALFVKQMLKWQYPAWQHGGNPRTRRLYPPANQMDIFPFIETLRICRQLGGLSKTEFAIFLLPVLNRADVPTVVAEISQFRIEREEVHGRKRAEFVAEIHKEHFRQVYAQEIAQGEVNTREIPTYTAEQFLDKKIRNSRDVADAAIRYFRATGLFTLSADFHGLAISSAHRYEVDRILDEMTFRPVEFYEDVDRFYEYMGNPALPVLPWESHVELIGRAITLGLQRDKLERLSDAELQAVIERRKADQKAHQLRQYLLEIQDTRAANEIVATFDRILRRDVVDPALFLEWNVWRVLGSLDDFREVRPNFTLDDDLKPFATAPGKKADIEVEYNDTFLLLVEVTLSSGARQYDTESEPVTRHVGRAQFEEKRKARPRMVYGLFIAPTINPSTQNYFYVHMKHLAHPDFGGYLNIVPLTMQQLVEVFQFCKSLVQFQYRVIKDLFDQIISLKDSTSNASEWNHQIPNTINAWKRNWGPVSQRR